MSDIAIRCDHLSKRYRIGERESYKALRDVITDGVASPFRRLRSALRNGSANSNGSHSALSIEDSALSTQHSELNADTRHPSPDTLFWALDDVSFEVRRGEVVGIIGRNGAGKSTLLKILSRITKPTKGRAEIHGRVGSLLEVGTGFHPELTGRENIYLNAAILGMRRAEVERKFDEIVAFAEVEQFIDTPVKRYSSGMYVRLAFAVAAHMETEVLIVDEVLAVGDAAFQKKCLGKMGEVARQGRTVLFVSHNMAAIRALCTRCVLLCEGKIAKSGEVSSVVSEYLQDALAKKSGHQWSSLGGAPGNDNVRLSHLQVRPPNGEAVITIDTGAVLEIGFYNGLRNINLDCTIYVVHSEGTVLFESGCLVSQSNDSSVGQYRLIARIPPHLLNAGQYYLNLVFGKDQRYVLFRMDEVAWFEVANTSTGRGFNMSISPGLVRPLLKWECEFNYEAADRISS